MQAFLSWILVRLLIPGLVLFTAVNCGRGPRTAPPPVPAPPSPPADSRDAPALASPELELRIEPSVIEKGESALLTWESRNAERVIIQPAIGTVDLSGRIKFFPDESTTYQVTAEGSGGQVTKSVRVEVATDRITRADLREEDIRDRSIPEQFEMVIKPVFFDFDSAELDSESRLALDINIRWLSEPEHSQIRFLIEGHADERGSEEYNLALSDKRAQVVRQYLLQNGIEAGRMSAVSVGEERPFVQGETEEAHALNRRAHFVMLGNGQ